MNVLAIVLLAWFGLTLALLIALVRAKPPEPDVYDLMDQR